MPFGPPTPEQIAQFEAYQQAVHDYQADWRRTITGPWSFLWCACKDRGPERCQVHGAFFLTQDGEIL